MRRDVWCWRSGWLAGGAPLPSTRSGAAWVAPARPVLELRHQNCPGQFLQQACRQKSPILALHGELLPLYPVTVPHTTLQPEHQQLVLVPGDVSWCATRAPLTRERAPPLGRAPVWICGAVEQKPVWAETRSPPTLQCASRNSIIMITMMTKMMIEGVACLFARSNNIFRDFPRTFEEGTVCFVSGGPYKPIREPPLPQKIGKTPSGPFEKVLSNFEGG